MPYTGGRRAVPYSGGCGAMPYSGPPLYGCRRCRPSSQRMAAQPLTRERHLGEAAQGVRERLRPLQGIAHPHMRSYKPHSPPHLTRTPHA